MAAVALRTAGPPSLDDVRSAYNIDMIPPQWTRDASDLFAL
jgi:hypothetical protein